MSPRISIAFLLFSIIISFTHASIGGYITPSDRQKFLDLALNALKLEGDDVTIPYYGARSFQLLSEPIAKNVKTESCARLKKNYKNSITIDAHFNALNAWKILECEGKLYTEATIKTLLAALEDEKSSTSDIHYALELLTLLGQKVPNPTKVAQVIQAKLKEDDSLPSLGHAIHAAALLGEAGKFAITRVEDVLAQADEVNGKLLQWEGGLTTTSLLITGILRLPGAATLTQVQADKLANYLLTRRTVQTTKGVLALLEAATSMVGSKLSPVSISILGASRVTVEKPELKIQISDIFGKPLKSPPSPVVAQSATRITDDVVVLAKQPLSPGPSPTQFILPLRLEPGHYRVALNAGNHATTLEARVLGPVTVNSFEIGLTDTDGSSAPKLSKLTYPGKLDAVLQGDTSQHLVLKFTLSRPVHQAFARLSSGKKEIIFIAEPDNSKVYKVTVNLAQELSFSGTFAIELIIGDSIMANPIRWQVGAIEVKLGATPSVTSRVAARGPKPEIQHMFRPKEKRPPKTVSLLFTGLTAAPLLLLLVLWAKIGINFGNFSSVALPFHLGFGAILSLFTLFWLKLDMFTTCAWLIPIGGFTFLAGHKLLSHIAKSKKPEKADK